jgi:putative transcriptional regulator
MSKQAQKKASVGTRIIRGLQELVESLEKKEPIAKKFNFRRIELNLKPTPYDPEMVKKTREVLEVSQAVFARLLGVSVRSVRSWEQGINTPSDIACRFMDEIRRDPPYWVKRLKSAAVPKPARQG